MIPESEINKTIKELKDMETPNSIKGRVMSEMYWTGVYAAISKLETMVEKHKKNYELIKRIID